MIATFSPKSLQFRAPINSTGPLEDLDLANPISFPASFPQDVHFDPAPQTTVVSAAVQPATGPFNVRDLLVFDVGFEMIHDPDAPHAKGKQKVLEFAGSRSGPGSIVVAAGQVLLVRASYQAGPTPGTENGQLVITTTESDTATVLLSLETFVTPVQAVVETTLSADRFSIVSGKMAQLTISVRSVSGPATDVTFEKSPIFLDAKVSMQPVKVHVEPWTDEHCNIGLPGRSRCNRWNL